MSSHYKTLEVILALFFDMKEYEKTPMIQFMIANVLEQVAEGLDWETIIEGWHSSITNEAIAEAVQLARQAFLQHVHEFTLEPTPCVNILGSFGFFVKLQGLSVQRIWVSL